MSKAGRLAGLDLLRFVAASSVMTFHLAFLQWANPASSGGRITGGQPAFPGLVPFTSFGAVGIEIFFVISGFVIAFSASKSTAGGFLRSRFLRLYPAALVCATLTLLALLLVPDTGIDLFKAYWRGVALWPFGPWIDMVYWTLGVELAFYALVFAHLLIGRFEWLEWTISAVGLGSCAAWALYFSGSWLGHELLTTRYGRLILAEHGMYFALGALLWVTLWRGANPRRLALIGIFVAAGLVPIAYRGVLYLQKFSEAGFTAPMILTPCLLWLASVGAIVAAARYDRPMPVWGPRIALLGLATYPLYLIHYRAGSVLLRLLVERGVAPGLALSLTLTAAVGAAVLVTLWPERVVRKLMAAGLSLVSRRDRRAERGDPAGTFPPP